MRLSHIKTIHAPQEGIAKVTGISWSANNRRLAIVTTDRVVHICDENGERRDKFSTKPADPNGSKNYVVRGMAWSPDSTKLAVAQSDNIVFVYKLGHEWGDKKSICNKFQQSSSITCICWPESRPNELVFGLAEGKMKARARARCPGTTRAPPTGRRERLLPTFAGLAPRRAPSPPALLRPPRAPPVLRLFRVQVGQLRSNKPATLYSADSFVVSCCPNPEGTAIISGHIDSRIYRFYFDDAARGVAHWELCRHSCVPYALAWGEAICAAGNDLTVCFYDKEGSQLQR